MHKKLRYPWLLPFASDFLAITAAYYTTLLLRFHSDAGARLYAWISTAVFDTEAGIASSVLERFYAESALRLILILTATICTLYALNTLYAQRRFLLPRPEIWLIIVSNVTALLIFYTYFYLTRNVFHPRSLFASVIVLNIVYSVLLRRLGTALMERVRRRRGIDSLTALIVGDSPQAEILATYLTAMRPGGIERVERLDNWLGNDLDTGLVRLREHALRAQADLLICAAPELSIAQIMQVLATAETLNLPAKILSAGLSVLPDNARLPTDRINGIPLVHFDAPRLGGRIGLARRMITWLLAAGLLVLLSPLILLLIALIRITSHGPALFVQERIGYNRTPFPMVKFRTMRQDAEEQQSEIESINEQADGALFKIRNDPRITPLGRLLRRFSLDELPQLANVLRGEMALVGPRPLPRRDYDNYYADWHYHRHTGLPGLTCLWQISGRSDLDFHQMCLLDIYYLRNHSWVLDLKIALRTAWTVLFAKGAY